MPTNGQYKRFTVATLIEELQKHPADMPVAVEWDDALSLFDVYPGEDQFAGALVLHAGWWGDFYDENEPKSPVHF